MLDRPDGGSRCRCAGDLNSAADAQPVEHRLERTGAATQPAPIFSPLKQITAGECLPAKARLGVGPGYVRRS